MVNIRLDRLLISIIFVVSVLGISIGTVYYAKNDLLSICDQATDEQKGNTTDSDEILKNHLWGKSMFIEFSGELQKLMGRRLSSDRQFYKDFSGVMHLACNDASYQGLLESTKRLAGELKDRGIPFLVCQTSERATYGDDYSKFVDGSSLKYLKPFQDVLAETETVCLDYDEVFRNAGFSKKQIFFKTDLHYTTNAEFCVLQNLIETLEKQMGLKFETKDTVLNIDNYQIERYDFLGNLGYLSGGTYTGLDEFEYYIPKFSTDLYLENPSQNVTKQGSFESVCLNGCRDGQNNSPSVYRITDYMQYPSPYYQITNNLVKNNNIIVIGDSLSMRTTAYLTLLCHSITVLDPRSFAEHNYVKDALSNPIDAVIFFPSSNLLDGIEVYDAEFESVQKVLNTDGTFDLDVQVKNTGFVSWSHEKNNRIMLWVDSMDRGLRAEWISGANIAPGERGSAVFKSLDNSFVLHNNSLQMVKEGEFYFGMNEPVDGSGVDTQNVLNARIVSHTAPTNVSHENSYDINIKVENVGTGRWSENDQIRLCIWQDGVDWGYRVTLPSGTAVLPGEQYTFTLKDFVCPTLNHTVLEFQMLQEGIQYFGEREKVDIFAG